MSLPNELAFGGVRPLRGRLRLPGDKSISHRALICSALADGDSRIRGVLESDDVRSTAGALRDLGVAVGEEAVAAALELGPQFAVVVDHPVEDDGQA